MTGTLSSDPIINHKKILPASDNMQNKDASEKSGIQENQVTKSSQHNFLHQHKMTISYFVVEIYFEWFNEYSIANENIFSKQNFAVTFHRNYFLNVFGRPAMEEERAHFPLC